jgi:GTP-binding protein
MRIPKVAITGRPNVGKSSLLNWLADRLISIVDPTAGVTRDRVTWIMHEGDRYFELIDTGGIGIVDSDDLSEDIERQIQAGIEEADLLLFVVDAKSGITPLDQQVARRLRKSSRPVMLVVNKCDSVKLDQEAATFLELADVPCVTTSVKANRGRDVLLEQILEMLPEATVSEQSAGDRMLSPADLRLAVVGRRNVGKSTFINQLAECERVIAIDTPGVRKRKSLENDIEFYGLVRAQRSIRRADLVLMFFDATQTISRVDKQLVEEISEQFKPCIFVVNKWDLAIEQGMTIDRWIRYLTTSFESMRHVPMAVVTAKNGRNIRKLVNLAQSVFKQASLRISTARLNRIVRAAIERNAPPMRKNRRPRIYFASQIAGSPPTIMLRCNDATLLDEGWKRYLLGFLRESTPFREVPIRLALRSRNEVDPDAVAGLSEDEPADIMDLTDDQLDDGDRSAGLDADLRGENVSATGLLMLGEGEDDFEEDFEEDPDYPAPNFIDDDAFQG